jgi:hypothetical protein
MGKGIISVLAPSTLVELEKTVPSEVFCAVHPPTAGTSRHVGEAEGASSARIAPDAPKQHSQTKQKNVFLATKYNV